MIPAVSSGKVLLSIRVRHREHGIQTHEDSVAPEAVRFPEAASWHLILFWEGAKPEASSAASIAYGTDLAFEPSCGTWLRFFAWKIDKTGYLVRKCFRIKRAVDVGA
jgi:hypothetical protein